MNHCLGPNYICIALWTCTNPPSESRALSPFRMRSLTSLHILTHLQRISIMIMLNSKTSELEECAVIGGKHSPMHRRQRVSSELK